MTESMLTDVLTFLFGMGCLYAFTRVLTAFFGRKRPMPAAGDTSALEARLARIEQIVESTSIEVERMTESQRFLVNVYAQRAPDPASLPKAGMRVTTPH
ncbi:MAG TPA: hypothetical protein VJO52_14475 [Gemmatimonadaceae bacterium]|nr:hypothetical protein [Gemmatimonadaceae bacterium]